MRPILQPNHLAASALKAIQSNHPATIEEVEKAIRLNKYVIVGMGQNPYVARARKALTDADLSFHYIEYGSYFSKWKQRLALKIWSGWATFPMVFVEGQLIGGNRELAELLSSKNSTKN